LVTWILFGCIASLLPFGIEAVKQLDSPENVTFDGLFGTGELLVVGAVLAAAALGEVISTGPRSVASTVLSFSCGAELVITSLWYADLKGKVGIPQHVVINGVASTYRIQPHPVARDTLAVFLFTIATCACSLYWAWRSDPI
jgi:hypothetical protein